MSIIFSCSILVPYSYSDIIILLDISGSMSGYRTQIEILFDDVFSNLNIGHDDTRIAFHTIYDRYGWNLASDNSYTVSSGSDILSPYTTDIYDGMYYSFGSTTFTNIQTNLIGPADRLDVPNIIIVIWDGDASIPDTNSSLGRYNIIFSSITELFFITFSMIQF